METVLTDPNVVDFGPLLQQAIQALGAVLLAVLSWGATRVVNRLARKFNLEIDDKQREYVTAALDKAVSYGVNRALDLSAGKGRVEVKNTMVALGLNYAASAVPSGLKHLGVDISTEEGRMRLADLIESRLPEAEVDRITAKANTGSGPAQIGG